MEDFKKKMDNVGEGVQLSASEKEAMRTRVREYMAHTPKRGSATSQTINVSWISYRFTAVLVVLALVFTSSIGVTYASTDALPGDTLYPVKEMREEIAEKLILNDEKRAEYAIERAHRRLQEVEKLAVLGKLDTHTEEIATKKFEHFNKRAMQHIAVLEERAPARGQALRVALAVGVETRAETLAMRAVTAGDGENEARGRIARVAQRHIEMEEASALAVVPRVETLAQKTKSAAPTEEVAMLAMDSAEEAAPQAMVAPIVPPERILTLVRNLQKQKEKLKDLRDKQDEEVYEYIDEVLKDTTKLQEEITVAVRTHNYADAEALVRKALRAVHKTLTTLDVEVEKPLPRILPKVDTLPAIEVHEVKVDTPVRELPNKNTPTR